MSTSQLQNGYKRSRPPTKWGYIRKHLESHVLDQPSIIFLHNNQRLQKTNKQLKLFSEKVRSNSENSLGYTRSWHVPTWSSLSKKREVIYQATEIPKFQETSLSCCQRGRQPNSPIPSHTDPHECFVYDE